MPNFHTSDKDFLAKLTEVTEANIINPQFGVSMLAKEMGMSRSNLHRKVNAELKITASQFINHARLKKAKEILRHTSDSVSEVAYEVGFNNVSYFIKCFHEFYGYSPGEIEKREEDENNTNHFAQSKNQKFKRLLIIIVSVVVLAVVLIIVFNPFPFQRKKLENTIMILPADNFDFRDSVYSADIENIIQNVISDLNRVNEIKITPWISVLQYRNKFRAAPEIAKERKVHYIVKPTARFIQGRVVLSLNLMNGPADEFIETFTYEIDSNNVTKIHLDIIKDITNELDIPINPAELSRINKVITSNNKALNYYYKGVDILYVLRNGRQANLEEAKSCFEKTIEYDPECAAAYAQLARIYYFMDYHWTDASNPEYEILYAKEINKYADIAYRIDPQLELSLIAKADYYMNEKEYEMATRYLEDALTYNPNSYEAMLNLCYIYDVVDKSEKFIKYALEVAETNFPEININDNRELGKERIYFELGAKYRALGFFDKALFYLDEAIKTNPDYLRPINEKSQVICDMEEVNNYQQSIDLLLDLTKKDSTTLGYTFLGLSYYLLRDYQNAYNTFNKFLEKSKKEKFTEYPSGRFAVVLSEMGEPEKARIQINYYREFAESSVHLKTKNYRLIGYYSFLGDTAKALEHLRIMSKYDHPYFRIRLLKDAPLYDNIRELPEFQNILTEMNKRWHEKRDSIRVVYKKKGLL